MSPIYVRPAREQAEHDRLIQFLEAKHQGKFEVLTNRGEARDYALKIGNGTYFPDLILQEGKKLSGVIEIETSESTNNLEALAQWVHFGRAKAPFHLYVPVLMYDAARRFCELNQVTATEIWTYRGLMEGFELLRVFHDPQAVARSGKGPAAKVVVMPKSIAAPKIEPVAELIEEVVRLGQKAEAARAARREAMRPSKAAIVKSAVPASKTPAGKPVEAVAKPEAKPAATTTAKPAAAAPVKPAAKAPAAKAVAPAKPAAKADKAKPAAKPAKAVVKPAKAVVKAAKSVAKPGKTVKPAAVKKPAAKTAKAPGKVAKAKAAKPSKAAKKPAAKPKKKR